MNPYQGLKHASRCYHNPSSRVTMPMNPYQGLKQPWQLVLRRDLLCHNANESLSGIETSSLAR